MRSLLFAPLALAACGSAAPATPAAPASPEPEPTEVEPEPEPAEPSGPALFAAIVAADREWRLVDGEGGEVVVALSRSVSGDVVIGRLTWTRHPKEGDPQTLDGLPAVIAVGPNGVDIHESADDLDDDAAVTLLAEADYTDPPAESKFDSGLSYRARLQTTDRGPIYCWGEDPPDEPDFACEDTCYAHLCWSATDGPVRLGGTWAPEHIDHAQEGY